MKNIELMMLGLISGFASAALGIGGGAIIVPALVLLFKFDIKKAVGSSLAALVPIVLAGVISHYVINSSNIKLVVVFFPVIGAVVGARIGVKLNRIISGRHLEKLLAFLLLFVALKLTGIIRLPTEVVTGDASYPFLIILGLCAGASSALFGIGGGVFFVPIFYLFFGLSMHEAVATSLTVILPTVLAGTVFHMIRNNVDFQAVKFIIPMALVGAVLGAIAANYLPGNTLRIFFAIFMLICSIRLFVQK